MVPKARPKLTQTELLARIKRFNVDRNKYPLIVVGIRGYYLNTMGKPGVNDRGIYDDAIFLDTPDLYEAFNANTDPSKYQKGIAVLKPGAWYAHRFDLHKGQYLALCQRNGAVTVSRDEQGEDTGSHFGINIHKGGYGTTSSLGCQTIHPAQWDRFISSAVAQAKKHIGVKWAEATIPYILIEEG